MQINFKEINRVIKKYSKGQLRVAAVYPNRYPAGINSLAIQILYTFFNEQQNIVCERVYYSKKPTSIETSCPLNKFDVIAVTFQYEVDYFNFIEMLLKSEVSVFSKKRSLKPLIIAGGPCITENPTPLSEFIDIFVIGEIEPIFSKLVDALIAFKKERKISYFENIPGLYIPTLMENKVITKNWVKQLDEVPYPVKQVLPVLNEKTMKHSPAFVSSYLVEVSRGCFHQCNFCLIGCQNLPYRERSLDNLKQIITLGAELNNMRRVSLIGSAFSDYSKLEDLLKFIINNSIYPIIPSLRPDKINESLIKLLKRSGENTVTLAPETASERLQKIINKNLDITEVINTCKTIYDAGMDRVKLYFIIGLPTEELSETLQIIDIIKEISKIGFKKRNISVSITPFVPKPHTRFQFEKQLPLEELLSRSKMLVTSLKKSGFDVNIYDPRQAYLQAILSRGDKKIGGAILLTVKYGGGLGSWRRAIKELGINDKKYLDYYDKQNYPWKYIRVKPF
ncbi:MAG: B12-binding domain-containing radical SAM protein [Candidatus Odinarchaeia archaeon]